eukprot:TRINITY_DN6517_c0_g1_i1.p1 TRINITY_DN6517_c0_g1~~TRINITY_DN6517_c0_g1_i1.p1  ORF type:complete len:593 (+),score=142.98 TRINITY_DN6517_c0_g1_i1:175-1779(+)
MDSDEMKDDPNIGIEKTITREDFEIGNLLSQGQESYVFEGTLNKTACVIKKSKKDSTMDYIKEINLMKKFNHPNVAQCLGAFVDLKKNNEILIFYEKLEPSERHILLSLGSSITNLQRIKYVHQLALGFAFLEGNKIFHGDIKLANTLYDRNADKLKICDFGFARDLTRNILGFAKGSPLFLAPEIWETLLSTTNKTPQVEYSFKMDVYSFTLMSHVILTGVEYASPQWDTKTLALKVSRGNYRPSLDLLIKYPESLKIALKKGWERDPNERLSFKDCVKIYNKIFLEMIMPVLPIPETIKPKMEITLNGIKCPEKLQEWFSFNFRSEEETQTKLFSIEFPEFIAKFSLFLSFPKGYVPTKDDDTYKLLQFLFKKTTINHLDLDAFSEYMPCFGPLDNGILWIQNVKTDVTLPGFYGRITKKQAESYLLKAKPREFLLRCSSIKGNFTVSICKGEGKVIHVMIEHAPFENLYSVIFEKKINLFSSLTEALKFVAKNFRLIGPVLIHPPNTRIFIDERQEISIYENFLTSKSIDY